MSKDDVESMGATLAVVQLANLMGANTNDFFFNIYLPHKDEVVWYKVERF